MRKKTEKLWAILDLNDDISDQWHSAQGVFLKKIYNTAETARNQIRKIPPEIPADIVEITVSYYPCPSLLNRTKGKTK